MANDNMKRRRLQELGESDFEVVECQSDIRGWTVKDGQGKRIGEVDELIVDAQRKKVHYMVVDLDDNELDLDTDREVLILIGLAELHEDDDDVIVPNLSTTQLSALPAYDSDHLDDEVERTICTALGRTTDRTESLKEEDFYQHDHFNDSRLYQRRLPASTSAASDNTRQGSCFQLRDHGMLSSDNTGDQSSTFNQSAAGNPFNSSGRIYEGRSVEDEATVPVNRQRSDTDIDRLMDGDNNSVDDVSEKIAEALMIIIPEEHCDGRQQAMA